MRNAAMLGTILAVSCSLGAFAVDTTEYWGGQNKDGNGTNSNARSIQGNLRLRWAASLRGFDKGGGDYWLDPRFSINVSVRNGRVLLAVPSTDPVALYYPNHYTTYGIYSLASGQLLSSHVNPQVGPGGFMWHYWKADGTVYAQSETDDLLSNARFNPYTGEVPFGLPSHNCTFTGDSSWRNSTSGGIGGFTMTDSNPLIYGAAGSFDQGGGNGRSEFGLLDTGAFTESSWKWQLPLLDGNHAYIMKAAVPTSNAGYITFPLYGQAIEALNLQSGPPFSAPTVWNYSDTSKQQISNGVVSSDGHIYYYAVNLNSGGAINYAAGETLVGVRTSDGVADVNIPVNYNMSADGGVPHASGYYVNTGAQIISNAQTAVLGNQVVVFEPEFDLPNIAHVSCFNTSNQTLAWRHDFPSGYFDPINRINEPFTGTISYPARMTVAGDSVYIVNAFTSGGNLTLKVDRLALTGGANTTSTVTPLDSSSHPIVVVNASTVLMQDVAAVDGALICLVNFDTNNQALAVIEGDASPVYSFPPVAVISAPATGTPMLNQQHFSNSAEPPSNQFDSGAIIAFSSNGSFDPVGGGLTYHWDFGNGATSSSANPSYSYPSLGSPGVVTNRTVTLTVTNSVGNSASTTRQLAINDVGTRQTLTFSAIADTYVDSAASLADSNFGTQNTMFYLSDSAAERGLIQFNLMSTAPSTVVAATLRLWAPPSVFINTTLNARAMGNSWNETTVTWNTCPAPGAIVGQKTMNLIPAYGFFIDIPVTAYAQTALGGDGLLSFEIDMSDPAQHIWIGTREGGTPAQLIVQVNGSGPVPPTITSALTATGTVGSPFSYSIAATNSPTSFNATGLPAGLSVNTSGGVISGTPTAAGTSNVTISATNAGGTGSGTLVLTISNALPPPPVITSALTASGTVGSAFSYTITATNSPTSFNAAGLPTGLSVNAATGVISGTPTAAGTTNVTISATNAGGTGSATLVVTINNPLPPPPTITSALSASGTVGSAFSYAITATNSPTSFNATGLPAGLSVNTSTGVISGTLTTAGTSNVTISATNAGGTGSATLTITINGSGGGSSTVVLQDGLNGYSGTRDTYMYKPWPTTALGTQTSLNADDVESILVRFAIFQSEGGPVPNGATIDSATLGLYKSYVYTYTGSPRRVLKNWVENEATWNNANASTPWSTPGAAGSGTDILAAADGTASIAWDTGWLSMDVTPGLQAFATGTANYGWYLSGVAGNAINFYSREYATDSTLRPKLTITYHTGAISAPVITSALTASGTVGSALSYTITATNSPTSFNATGLPAGLSVNTATGVISGIPTTAGTSNVAISATNAGGTGTAALVLTINNALPPPPVITSALSASGTVGSAFNYTITATNSPTSFTATGLPAGLSLNTASGVISGTPTVAGTSAVTISASNAGGTGSATLTITINSSGGGPTTVTLQDGLNGYSGTRDTYMYKPWAGTVLGTQTTLISDDIDSILVRFAIFQSEGGPVPNGATIDSATLGLYKSYYYNYTGSPRRVLKNWVETEATWNNAKATTAWSAPGATGAGTDIAATPDGTGSVGWTPGWLSMDVSPGVQAFATGTPNYGWYLSGIAGNAITFYSREYATDRTLRPMLTVTYHGGTSGNVVAGASIGAPVAAPQAMTISKLSGTANFTASGRDTVSILGVVPASSPAGQTVLLNVNGARASFKLDAKGHGKSAQGSFAMKSGKFTAKLRNGTWSGGWGLNLNASATKAKLAIEATMWIGSHVYTANVSAKCTSKAKVGAKISN